MKRSLAHLLLGILICIMSLQGVAAGLLACCAPQPAAAADAAGQHAGHGMASAAPGHAAHAPAALEAHDAAPAHACSACIAGCSTAAMLPDALVVTLPAQAGPRSIAAAAAPVNHVPDTPERPPRSSAT